MRKKLLPLLLIGGAAALFFFFRRSRLAANLKYLIRDVSLRGRALQPKIEITIGIQNPTNQKATVRSIVGTVSWNGKEFANVSKFEKNVIEPNIESLIPIYLEPSIFGSFNIILDLIKKGGLKNGVIKFDGSVNVDNINIPVTIERRL